MSRYVEDASMASSSNLADEPILPGSAPPPTNALVAIVEKGMGGQAADEKVRIAMVSVVPGTGDVVWDEFDGMPIPTQVTWLTIRRLTSSHRIGD
jgi:DNA mismatch repair protein MSH3